MMLHRLTCLCAALCIGSAVRAQEPPAPPAPAPTPEGYAPAPPPPPDGAMVGHDGPLVVDLPTALQMVNATNPTIALARERVREAYWHMREAKAAFLPNLYAGPQYNRHDGTIQNSAGNVFNTDKWNFFIGGSAALEWDTPNVLFGPLIARRLMDAVAAASQTVTDDVQLQVALTYLDLLAAYGRLAINVETIRHADEMLNTAKRTRAVGLGITPSDYPRAMAESSFRREQRYDFNGQVAVASARLAQLLILDPTADLQPADPCVLPIVLVPENVELKELVITALMNRPELAESRALAAAAVARWRQAQVTPLLPRVQAGYSSGYFDGGINDSQILGSGRGDGTVMLTWELRGLGLADYAAAKARHSQYDQATIHIHEVEAQVAAEVTAAAKLSITRRASLADAQVAVKEAETTWIILRKALFGVGGPARQYDPLQGLTAEQALDQARMQYLTEVIEYNKAQFRLYWAMGHPPLEALPCAAAVPLAEPVVPVPRAPEKADEKLPMPQRNEPEQ